MKKYILWFKEISKEDVPLVGGKNASLGEMLSKLSRKGVQVPNGFAITADAFWYYLSYNKIDEKLKEIFEKFDPKSIKSLKETGEKSRNLILKGKFPPDLEKEILENYQKLSKFYSQKNVDVAVRSSATAEDLATASFAGQHESYINISGNENVLRAVKKCFASLLLIERLLTEKKKDSNI
jgi:pyruvate,water dikinase